MRVSVWTALRSLCRNSRGQRPSFFLSISLYRFAILPTRFALFPDEEKNSYPRMSPFSRTTRWLYIANRSYTILSNHATSNEISILVKRALRKKCIDDRYRYVNDISRKNSRCFLFPFFSPFFLFVIDSAILNAFISNILRMLAD